MSSDCLQFFCIAMLCSRAAVTSKFSSRVGEASISREIVIAFQLAFQKKEENAITTLSISEGSFNSKFMYSYQIECLIR